MEKEIDDLEDKVNSEIEAKFKEEDSRLQAVLSNLQAAISTEEAKITETLQRAKAELLVLQKYILCKTDTTDFSQKLELETKKEIVPEWFDCSKPRDLKVYKVSSTGRIFVSFTRNTDQERALVEKGLEDAITYKILL